MGWVSDGLVHLTGARLRAARMARIGELRRVLCIAFCGRDTPPSSAERVTSAHARTSAAEIAVGEIATGGWALLCDWKSRQAWSGLSAITNSGEWRRQPTKDPLRPDQAIFERDVTGRVC